MEMEIIFLKIFFFMVSEERRIFLPISVEGRNQFKKQHVTLSLDKHQDINQNGMYINNC